MNRYSPDYPTRNEQLSLPDLTGGSELYIPALARQVDGSHYKDYPIQPVEFAEANGLPYCVANGIKYVVRHRDKNGKKDLLKASHYCELGVEVYERTKRFLLANPPEGWVIIPAVFLQANKITGLEAEAIKHLLSIYTCGVLGYLRAKECIDRLAAEYSS